MRRFIAMKTLLPAALCLFAGTAYAAVSWSSISERIRTQGVVIPAASTFTAVGVRPDIRLVAQAVAAIDHLPPANVTIERNEHGDETALVGTKVLIVDSRHEIVTVHDPRLNDHLGQSSVSDQELIDRSRPLVAALGIVEGEVEFEVHGLGATGMRRGDTQQISGRLATKVYCNRKIDGLAVPGDRVVITYSLDGSLTRLIAHWRRVDAVAPMPTTNVELVRELALRRVEAEAQVRNIVTSPSGPVEVQTFYDIVNVDGATRLLLRGAIRIPVVAPNDQYRMTELPFDL